MNRGPSRVIPLLVIFGSAVIVPLLVLRSDGLPRLRNMQDEMRGIQNDNEQERREISRLRAEIKALREDPAAVERIAREQLGMVRKTEVVYQFSSKPKL
jgi:cell division protein FtsB